MASEVTPSLIILVFSPVNFAAFSPFLAAYSTLDFTMSPLAGKTTWYLLPTTPSVLPTATKHFDRAGSCDVLQKFRCT